MDIAYAVGVSDKWGEEMSRLIRYDDAIERLGAYLMADAQIDWGETASTDIEDWKELADMILNAVPTINAVSVVHGEWMEREVLEDTVINEWQSARCSECGKYHTTPYMYFFDNFNYCPNCGADMRGDRR